MFKISFTYLDKTYSGIVEKIDQQPVQFVVFGITPFIRVIPERLVYESSPIHDQLIYCSFNIDERKLLQLIGESIFFACDKQQIAIHA